MEQSNSLLLNEEGLNQQTDQKKPLFVYEWLRYLNRILPLTQKADIKSCQQKLIEQLTQRISTGPGPPTRILLAKCIAQVFSIADTYDLFQTINICNDALKVKDESVSQLPIKLTALQVLGAMYENLGRMVGRSYEESYNIMSKWIKSAESSSRAEILITLSKMVHGLGSAAYSIHRDLYKMISKAYLTDRVMNVRMAAATCLLDLVSEENSPVYANDLDSISTICLRALEGSNYEVRLIIASVFAKLVKSTVAVKQQSATPSTSVRTTTLEEALNFLATGFLRGGIGGFLKSSTGAAAGGHKEIRVGVALAYVEVVKELGASWLEKNLLFFIRHILEVVYKCGPLAYTTNPAHAAEVVYMRRCISYIFRNTLGQLLSEPAQILACKHLGELLNEYINSFDCSMETEERILNADAYSSAQTSIVILMEISSLVRQIGTSVTPLFVEASGIMEPVFACLLHPIHATRIAAAWCLRCVTYSVPSQATPIVDRCINRLEHMKKSGEAVSGCSLALAGLLAGSQDSQLGIPFCKSRQVFSAAEDMIKTATQTCKLAHKKLQAGWMLITAVTSMGSPFMRHNVGRLLMLWKHSFPRSTEEAKGEKSRGDIFTWECTLENRAGALASMDSFLQNCPDLVTDDVIKKIVLPVETSLTTMALVAELLFTHGTKLRAPIYGFRIRLYSLLSHLNMKYFEHAFSQLLRELVADITLSDNAQITTCSSLVAGLCTSVESCFLGGWPKNTDHAMLEYEPNPMLAGTCGSLEYDPIHLITGTVTDNAALWPEPLPTHIAALDAAILAFGRVYPVIPTKHKLQLTNHFLGTFKKEKQGPRLYSIQLNILSAVLCAMKATSELRHVKIDGEELQKANIDLVVPFLNSDRLLLKSLAIETLGRLAQAVGEPQFVAGNAQLCFDRLRSIRDEKSRTGFSLTLGCLHRFVGSLGSGQHLNTSVSIILALAQDNSSPAVQAWATLSLSLIANTGGGMFRGYVEITLNFCLKMLMSTAAANSEIVLCIGKLISSLITSIGPELQSTIGTIDDTRASLLTASSMMLEYSDPQIKAEAIACYQQLHLFATRFVQLDRLVTIVCNLLYSEHLILRKAAVACLRQLLQREAREVREHAQNLLPAGIMDQSKAKESPLPETGLEGALFELLDTETDKELRQHIKECLLFLVQATSSELLGFWLTMCKDILASSMSPENMRSTMMIDDTKTSVTDKSTTEGDDKDDGADDEDTLQAVPLGDVKTREKVSPRWQTRVFAFEIVQRLMAACETERAHLDLALAKELQMSSHGRADYLVLHLSDLVRMSFMGATSDNSNLRLAGLACLQDVINRFAAVPEPEFPGHVILEQFQAQVGAALRPAFVPETPSHVTAAACQVCSTWIGSGVARDLNDLRRVHQLLVSSLGKLKHGSINTQLYNDSAATLEKLSILKAWAEVYIVAVKQQDEKSTKKAEHDDDQEYGGGQESLLNLVNPELNALVGHWLDALRDSALLSLPAEFGSQLPEEGGAFYTPDSAESCKEYYRNSWPPILLAASIWLNKNNFEIDSSTTTPQKWSNDRRETRFHLMLGMCAEALCSRNNHHDNDKTIQLCLNTLKNLIECEWAQLELMKAVQLPVEVMNILHRLILTRDNLQTQRACADVVLAILQAAKTAMKRVTKEDADNGNPIYKGYQGNEGANGFEPKSSLSFATLEICLCLLVRQIPQINSSLMKSKPMAPLHFRKYARLPMESYELIQIAIQILVQVPSLCSPEGAIIVLPSIFYLILGVLRESSRIDQDQLVPDSPPGHVSVAAAAAMVAIRTLTSTPPIEETSEHWSSVMRSFLLSLINLSESDIIKVDKAVIMLATTVLVTSMPTTFAIGSALFHKYCRLLKSCVDCEHVPVQVKGLQSVNSIFARKEICAPYIRELGPVVFAKIKPYVVPEAVLKGEKDETQLADLEDLSDAEAVIIQEAIKAVEAVLSFSKGEKEMMFVNLLTRCLARFLFVDPVTQLKTAQLNVRKMHEFAFQRLNLIGPQHPECFKAMIQGCPRIKQRIEAAAQVNQRLQQAQQQAEALKKMSSQKAAQPTVQQPKIQLTMNFAAFENK